MKTLFKHKAVRLTVLLLAALLITFGIYYVTLPAINVHNPGFWIFCFFVLLIYGAALGLFDLSSLLENGVKSFSGKRKPKNVVYDKCNFLGLNRSFMTKIGIVLILAPIVVLLIGGIFSSTFFNARRYASVIEVEDRVFTEDMPSVSEITNIALVDTESAIILGERKLGRLEDVVSQYIVSSHYTQINYQGHPMKVASLEYDGFFKWLSNRNKGVPGYIMVDAVLNKADYMELPEGMIYTESAYFGEYLERKLRFDYPTKIFDRISFEVDESGKVWYVVSCATARVGLFGAMDIHEVILFDPVTGTSELMKVENTPTWVDIVYDGYLACEKYDWKGLYSGGYLNSLIGNKGCKQTTDDFGYIMKDDDVWYFTGVTSITADQSNIGFVLSCARTGEYIFYLVEGAEEHSAMGAAEGEVQEKEYNASFPTLVNIAGEPTYIMVLKDANALVKLYALVNVKQYNIVATATTQSEVIAAYIQLLEQNGISNSDTGVPDNHVDITVQDVKFLTLAEVDYAYVTATDKNVYRIEFNSVNESVVLLKSGDVLTVKASLDEKTGIYRVTSWEWKK
ncbi:MAG: hypothetical protein IKC63_04985 [Clostridia bacterium]|nr:hypothetical protein [Clostridia bacterium]